MAFLCCARMGGGLCGACVKALADFGGVKSRRLDRPQRNSSDELLQIFDKRHFF